MTEKQFYEYLQAYHNGDVSELKKEVHTEKRFISKESVLSDGFVIVDTLKQYTFPVLEATDNYSIMKALNELNEENEYLKHQLITLDGLYVSDKEDMSDCWRLDLFSDEAE